MSLQFSQHEPRSMNVDILLRPAEIGGYAVRVDKNGATQFPAQEFLRKSGLARAIRAGKGFISACDYSCCSAKSSI